MKKNIVLATDDNYVEHCAVTMLSILLSNKDVDFYLLYEHLSPLNIKKLEDLVKENEGTLSFIKIDEKQIEGFPMSEKASDHISITTYLRLFSEKVLPNTISRALYLDCDMVIVDDLNELFELDMDNYAIATVYQYNQWAYNNDSFGRLFIPQSEGYFNAGTLLINLDFWRKNGITEKLFDFIRTYKDNIISHDQDVLNAVLYNRNLPLHPRWNLLPFFVERNFDKYEFPHKVNYAREVSNAVSHPAIIHFVSKPKPWEYGCKSKFKGEYYRYLLMLPWETRKPSFNLKEWFKNIILPSLVDLKHSMYGHR
jgi:lipopolysaccharide biosynthesis glycosyltransferase